MSKVFQTRTISRRSVHAVWTVMLDHEWIEKDEESIDSYSILSEPLIIRDSKPRDTVLLLHDNRCNRQLCRPMAQHIVQTTPSYRCLLVDIRGHGFSDADNFDKPHSVASATADIIDLIASISTGGYVSQPKVVIGFGSLGSSLALSYLEFTRKGLTTMRTHSEISGKGAIATPSYLFLIDSPSYPSIDVKDQALCDSSENFPDNDIAISSQLETSVATYLTQSVVHPVKFTEDAISASVLSDSCVAHRIIVGCDDNGPESSPFFASTVTLSHTHCLDKFITKDVARLITNLSSD